MYGWVPDMVWRLRLSEALAYRAARMRMVAAAALMLWSPLSKEGQGELTRLLEGGERALSFAEEFGRKMANEVAAVEQRAREWVRRKRGEQ